MAEGYEVAAVEEVQESIKPIKVQKGRSTGTAELKAIATAVEKIVSIAERVASEIEKPRYEREITENFGKDGPGAATDITLINTLGSLLDKTAKISGTKYRMSSADYTPTATVVAKLQQTFDIFAAVMKEHLGPIGAQGVIDETIDRLADLWHE